jgi:hypothetical protein
MYKALRAITQELVQAQGKQTAAFLSREYTVYNWNRITVFTGSCIVKYSQSAGRTGDSAKAKTQAGSVYATVPNLAAAGSWAGQALAFIAEDFRFWAQNMCQLDPSTCLDDDAFDQIYEIHIRFRFEDASNSPNLQTISSLASQGHDLHPLEESLHAFIFDTISPLLSQLAHPWLSRHIFIHQPFTLFSPAPRKSSQYPHS